jgi:TPR repeat protein
MTKRSSVLTVPDARLAWLLLCALGLAAAAGAPPARASVESGQVAELMVVDCLLPPQVRKLGRRLTYLSQRQATKTSAQDCEISGGEYVAYDRANHATALTVWLELAQKGDPQAQTFVGEIFEKGQGTAPDFGAAIQWYRKAAEQGYARAQINLGHLYEKGQGVGKDPVAALNWYRKAAGIDALITLGGNAQDTARLDAEIAKLRRELEDARRELEQLKHEKNKLDSENNRLLKQKQAALAANDQAQVRALEARLRQREQDLARQHAAMAQAQQDIQNYQRQLAGLGTDREREAFAREQSAAELQSLRLSLEQTRTALVSADRARLRLEQEKAALVERRQVAVDARDRDAVKKLETQLTQRDQALTRQTEELARINQTLAAQREQIVQLEVSRQSERLARIEAEKQGSQDARALRQELDAARGTLAKAIGDRQTLELDKQNLNRELTLARQANASGKVQDLESRLRQREDELARQREKVAQVELEAHAHKQRLAQLEKDLRILVGEQRSINTAPAAKPPSIPPIDYGGYHALVIGNEDYAKLPKLDTAIEDAEAVGKILSEKFRFKVTLLKNADRYQILTALNKLRQTLTEKDNLLIYYAGHGELDRANLRGHWLPVDAEPDSDANWISNVAITDILNAMSAKHVLVVADSCYSGAMTRSSVGGLKAGMSEDARATWLKALAKARSRTVLTSGGLAPVIDGGGGRHSIFCKNFLDVLAGIDGVIEAQKIWQEVAARVLNSALRFKVEQKPEYSPLKFAGHEAGDFLFVPTR